MATHSEADPSSADEETDLMTDITIVIPALNAASTLAAQLTALRNQRTDTPFEVIVVDNGSTDNTAGLASSFNGHGLSVKVVSETRRGTNFARNTGIGAATGEIVLLCDADDEVHDGWVAALCTSIDDNHWSAGPLDYVGLNSEQTRLIWGAPDRSTYRPTEPYIDNTSSCNCGFTKQMWSTIGGFSSALSGVGGDDNEFFQRAHAAGYRLQWAPEAVVKYRLRPGVRGMTRQRYRQGRAQTRLQKLPGGAHLRGTMQPSQTLGRMFKLILASPLYLWSAKRRFEWLGAASRHVGRLAGWWQNREWEPPTDLGE